MPRPKENAPPSSKEITTKQAPVKEPVKEFLSPLTIRDNALSLARRIHADGFTPTIIYVGLRGGATFGNVISEYFKLAAAGHVPLYAAVVAHSYGVFESQEVHIDGWTYSPSLIRPTDSVMLIDDIFDSGKTINVVAKEILKTDLPRERLKIVVHDYKIRKYNNVQHEFLPDYYSRKLVLQSPEEDNWIHYLSHELAGLTEAEVRANYPPESQEVILKLLASEHPSSAGSSAPAAGFSAGNK